MATEAHGSDYSDPIERYYYEDTQVEGMGLTREQALRRIVATRARAVIRDLKEKGQIVAETAGGVLGDTRITNRTEIT